MTAGPPNIILIITDQQRYDTIAALGFPFVDTPHLDRLANEGAVLANCHITAPSCAPSRASLFSGHYPHTTGVFKNEDQWKHSWVELLADAGYRCVNIGKMHTFPPETPLGFHERYVVENKDRHFGAELYLDEWDKALHARGLDKPGRVSYRNRPDYDEEMGAIPWELPEDLHPDTFVGDLACWWLDKQPKQEPLFMEIGFPGPHPPYDPPQRYVDPYLEKELPIQGVTAPELDLQPPPLHALRRNHAEVDHDAVVFDLDASPEKLRRVRAHYLANVTLIDEKVGAIFAKLEERGYLDDAVVIFTSDHGDCLGDHGHSQKWTMYDIVTRVPAIVWSPGRIPAGEVFDQLFQWMDLGPTILQLAGIDPPSHMEARSLMPVLTGISSEGRDYVFAEQGRDFILNETSFMTMVRSVEWKLVHFHQEAFGQLFDLTDDPEETRNLWDDPASGHIKQELLSVLREWLIESNRTTADWSREWR
ncbi:MAG: sulfatase-like hydrolase/transferase [Trueperaceae bacterium]